MSLQFTPQGMQIETFDDIFNRLVADYKSIYGEDIDLSQNTADGQRIGIAAKALHDLQTSVLELYNSLDVDKSEGVALDRMIAFCGIVRRPPTKSSWDVQVTASQPVLMYSGYTIKDDAGQEWTKQTAVNLSAGTTTVTFEAKEFGSLLGLIGATLEQVTIIPQITGLSAVVSANVGVDEETDFELRERRNVSLQNPAYSTIGSITAKLANLPGVTDVYVYENKTPAYNATIDLDGHSIWVVVEGGEIDQITETMVKQKTAGAGEKGDVVGEWLETIPNGVVILHQMRFDRPVYTDLYIRMNATSVSVNPVDVALIKQNLEAKTFRIAQGVEAYTLYPIAGAGLVGNAYLSDLEVSDDGTTWTDGSLDAVNGGKYVIDPDNITVNV